jgi:hypothetical protein
MCHQYNNCCKLTQFTAKTRKTAYTVVRFMDNESHAKTFTVPVKTGMAQKASK